MATYLSDAVLAGLSEARQKQTRKGRNFRVETEGVFAQILDLKDGGFTVAHKSAPVLQGHVNLFEGPRHLFRCLIVASETIGDVRRYRFKQCSPTPHGATLDYTEKRQAPHALIDEIRSGL